MGLYVFEKRKRELKRFFSCTDKANIYGCLHRVMHSFLIFLPKVAKVLLSTGFGRLFSLFWWYILLGSRRSSLDSLRNPNRPSLLQTMWLMDFLLWILFSHSLLLTLIKPPIYLLMNPRRLLWSMQGHGWSLMSYPQFLLNLHRRFPLRLSVLMDYSTCFVSGVSEESVLFSPGTKTFPFRCISINKYLPMSLTSFINGCKS